MLQNVLYRLVLFCMSLAIGFAGEGVMLISADVSGGETTKTEMNVEPHKVAVKTIEKGQRMTFVYLANEGIMRMIDHSRQTYREMTKQDVEAMSGQVNDAMAQMRKQMEERLKSMDPKQREMVEKMMQGRMGAAAAPKPKVEKTVYRRAEGSKTVGQWQCDNYIGTRGGVKVSDVCATDWSEFDARPEDFAVFREMSEMFSSLSPDSGNSMPAFGSDDWKRKGEFPGVPVEQTRYRNGQPVSTNRLEEFRRGTISEEVYEAPAGFKMQQGFGGL